MRIPRLIAVAALLLTACQDVSGPVAPPSASEPSRREQLDAVTAEVLAAARKNLPGAVRSETVIGVLERGATPFSRLVAYEQGNGHQLYRFVKRGGSWERLGPIQERTGSARSLSGASGIYPHRIAKIGYDVADWYSSATSAGTYSRAGYWNWYDGTYGRCYPGSYTSGGQTTTLRCDRWYSSRNDPSASWYTFGEHSGFSDYICHGYNCRNWGAQNLELVYTLSVEAAFTVSVSGPTSITQSGQYTWQAQPVGGDGTYTYQWQVYHYGSGTTQVLGTGQTESLYVDQSNGDFEISVTATSAGRTATGSLYVMASTVGGCPDPTQIICT